MKIIARPLVPDNMLSTQKKSTAPANLPKPVDLKLNMELLHDERRIKAGRSGGVRHIVAHGFG